MKKVCFGPRGNMLASCGYDNADKTVRLWDVATGAHIGSPLTIADRYNTTHSFYGALLLEMRGYCFGER